MSPRGTVHYPTALIRSSALPATCWRGEIARTRLLLDGGDWGWGLVSLQGLLYAILLFLAPTGNYTCEAPEALVSALHQRPAGSVIRAVGVGVGALVGGGNGCLALPGLPPWALAVVCRI